MKYFSLFLILLSLNVSGQRAVQPGKIRPADKPAVHSCATDLLRLAQLNSDPSYQQKLDQFNEMVLDHLGNRQRSDVDLTIPVVVHIIHNNGIENITDQQVLQGIEDLNLAFANSLNYNDPSGVQTHIQFCLARKTPDGQFTSGITRTVSDLTNVTIETQDDALKNLIRWDPLKYLNIWLVKEITSASMGNGVAGYAFFPSSHGQAEDGIVNEAHLFGSTPDNSKVHIHEAGHYLGLYHTFEAGCTNGNCMTDGDHVCDTPPDNSTAPVNCLAVANTCQSDDDDLSINNPFRPAAQGGLGDQPDMFQNYMDYGYQSCQTRFTQDQSARMYTALTESRASLLLSTACQSPCNQFVSLDFGDAGQTALLNQTVTFTKISAGLDVFEWTMNGITFSNTDEATYLFSNPGTYVLRLHGSSISGLCNLTIERTFVVECNTQAAFTMTPGGPYNPGATIAFTDSSTNSGSLQWILDGQIIVGSTSFQQTYPEQGSHSIYLVNTGSQCTDTSTTRFFGIGSCTLSGVDQNWVFARNVFTFNPSFADYPGIIGNDTIWTECTTSISDADGNLLFFSDGNKVWNKFNQVMPNGTGLLGNSSSTQGVMAVPMPGSNTKYYVFTNDAIENLNANGLRYTVVDMALDGGLGAVIPSTKNTLVCTGNTEKLTATWHANGSDIWIATAEINSNRYLCFLLSDEGLIPQPVISALGPTTTLALSAMKFSHDGNRVAVGQVSDWPWSVLAMDFDKATGVMSHVLKFDLSSDYNEQIYDLEFSPDNSKLYASFLQGNHIYQYDLTQTSQSAIQATRYTVDNHVGNAGSYGKIKLAPDGRLYTFSGAGTLEIITNPNNYGPACGYIPNVTQLVFDRNPDVSLPNTLQGYLQPVRQRIIGRDDICVGGIDFEYSISHPSEQDSVIWTHAGPGTLTATNGPITAHLTSAAFPATDTIWVVIYGRCVITRDTLVIRTNNPGILSLGPDQPICSDPIVLTAGNNFFNHQWQDGSAGASFTAVNPGNYSLQAEDYSGCILNDQVNLFPFPGVVPPDLGADRSICDGQTTIITPAQQYATYRWQDNSTQSNFTVWLPGTYWVTVSNGCNSATDTIRISSSNPHFYLNYTGDSLICADELPFTLQSPSGYDFYLWQDGSANSTYMVTAAGQYVLTATKANGCYARDTVWVDACLGMKTMTATNGLSVFPNPSDQSFLINYAGNSTSTLLIFNAAGQLILKEKMENSDSKFIATAHWAQGIYFIELRDGEKILHSRIVVGH